MPCIGRQILDHYATSEVLGPYLEALAGINNNFWQP